MKISLGTAALYFICFFSVFYLLIMVIYCEYLEKHTDPEEKDSNVIVFLSLFWPFTMIFKYFEKKKEKKNE